MPASVSGSVSTWSTTYTHADLVRFLDLVGEAGPEAAATIPPLLAIAPLTKLGGDLDYLAHRISWTSTRPFTTGEELTAELQITAVGEGDTQRPVSFEAVIRVADEVVLRATSTGFIWADPTSEQR